jgi:hypothetical protein
MADDVRITKADALDGDIVLIELSDGTTLKVTLEELLSLNPERLVETEEEE